MKKIILLFIILTFSMSNLAFANEQVCKKFDVFCKSKNGVKSFWKNTKEFQKKGITESADQIKSTIKK